MSAAPSSTPTTPQSTPRTARLWRAVLLGLIVGFLALLTGPAASAAPVKDLTNVPADLQKYVPNTQAFANSPWMTSPTCKDKGGDFSIWASNAIQDTPSLLAYFQSSMFGPEVKPEDKPRSDAIIAGYRQLATEVPAILPPGYCVDDMKRWTGADYTTKPFGFPWGMTSKDGHQAIYYCTDRADPNTTRGNEYNRYFGAERTMCDAFYITCNNAQENEKAKCEAWNTFSDEYVRRVEALRAKAINEHKATGTADTHTELKSPSEVIGDIAGGWFADLTKTIAEGSAKLMAEAMSFWTRTDRTTMLQSPAITEIQGLLRYVGIALLAGSVIWQGIVMIYKRKLDPLVSTGMGLLSFVGWSTLGGTVAVLLNEAGIALANDVLDQSINTFSKTVGDSLIGQVGVATGAIFFLSIILFFLACIQWVLGFFRMGALVILLALLPTAAAGQANESTKPWLKKVLSWCLSLILYQPIAAIIFAIGLQLIGSGQDISTVLVGMAVIALAVISMPTMLRFFDWGGQQLVNSGGGAGGAMAVGAAASALGGGGVGGFGKFMDQSGPAGGGGGGKSSGALPVSSAHAGDGPGGGGDGPSGSGGDGGSQSASGPGGGQQGGPGGGKQGVSSATGGQQGGSSGQSPVGAGVGGGGGSEMAAAGGGGQMAAAGGGGAMAAHPAGAAALAANEGKEGVKQGFNAAAGAMTEGAGESGGPQ
jgi:hypothetical protein